MSGHKEHYETTLERVREYYGLVMSIERFKKAINDLDEWRKTNADGSHLPEEVWNKFLNEFELLDPRSFALTS